MNLKRLSPDHRIRNSLFQNVCAKFTGRFKDCRRQAAGSNSVLGVKTPDIVKYPAFYNLFPKIIFTEG